MSLSSKLELRRKQLNMTLLEVANKVGVTESTVQRWESGNIKTLRHERIVKLAEALDVTPSYLMGWDDEQVSSISAEFIPGEDRLLSLYRELNEEGREKLIDYADDMTRSGKYKKNNPICLADGQTQ